MPTTEHPEGNAEFETTQSSLPPSEERAWYALRIQSRMAAVASSTLRSKGYEEFLPLYRSRRRWSDRTKEVELPLFPGYLFCRFDIRERLMPILTTPGVISIVSAGKNPVPVDNHEIEAVRAILNSGLAAQPWPLLNVGAKIRLTRGPLSGLEGIIVNTDKIHRIVVSVSLLQRSVAVEIAREWARLAADGTCLPSLTQSERKPPISKAG